MLKISRQQMDSFRAAAARAFEERMVAHLAERFPLRSASLGEPELLRVIQKGLGSAALHGIVKEKDVCRLIELMYALGEGASATPDDSWVAEILDKATPANFSARLEQLGALAAERLAQPDPQAADPAVREEAAAALASPEEPPFHPQAGAEDPVAPCPGASKKRLCSFSS
jgi:hypothetical protein